MRFGGMGQQICDCLTYFRFGLDLTNTFGIVTYYKFIFCSVLKEGKGRTALEQSIPSILALPSLMKQKYVDGTSMHISTELFAH